MALRPVFIPNEEGPFLVTSKLVNFEYYSGFSIHQKQKSIDELHSSIEKELGLINILEVSSKSKNKLGVDLSAFNLEINDKNKKYSVECAFQGSKVFENGGHFLDIFNKTSREAKKDERLTSSGNLIGFNFYHTSWGLTPPTAFYDWLYINTLNSHKNLHNDLLNYNAFTDIEFNPKKSLNCQAYSVAMFVSIYKRNLINLIKKPNSFLKLYSDYHVSNTVNENKKFILQRNLF